MDLDLKSPETKEWQENVLKNEGLEDWVIRMSPAGGYCWQNQKTIDLLTDSPVWFLHEVAHALYPSPEGEFYNHYHGGMWATTFANLIEKYMTRKDEL